MLHCRDIYFKLLSKPEVAVLCLSLIVTVPRRSDIPSRPVPVQREKINLNFYFNTSLWCLEMFYEGLKGFHKTF